MVDDRNERRPRDQHPTNMSEDTSESTPPGDAEKDLDAGDERMPGGQDRWTIYSAMLALMRRPATPACGWMIWSKCSALLGIS